MKKTAPKKVVSMPAPKPKPKTVALNERAINRLIDQRIQAEKAKEREFNMETFVEKVGGAGNQGLLVGGILGSAAGPAGILPGAASTCLGAMLNESIKELSKLK